jgi:2'-5' RNA ligase
MKTYYLWLEPTGKTYELLATTIAHLSQEHGGPLFDPHVTLLGDIAGQEGTLIQKTEKLAHALSPFDLTLTVPTFLDEYFRCVFMRVEETSTLLEAHTLARTVFHKEDAPPYLPHLSLLYGSYPRSLKEQIIGTMSTSLSVQFTASAVTLFRVEGDSPKDWHRVQTFGFSGRDTQEPSG